MPTKQSEETQKLSQPKIPIYDTSFRLLDFNIFDEKREQEGEEDNDNEDDARDSGEKKYKKDEKFTTIQMFGLNEKGETCAIFVRDYQPFFYIKVGDEWTIPQKAAFISHLKEKVGKFYENSILDVDSKLIRRKKLYGFDGGKEHKFILIKFKNVATMNKVKNMWFKFGKDGKQLLRRDGYPYFNTKTEIYESNIPPLLRFFHIHDISPSGWIGFQAKNVKRAHNGLKTTTCNYEYELASADIVPLNNKETIVPYKICSFDIEASSSHGDFPIPIKTYKKLAMNIVDVCDAICRNAGATTSEDAATYITPALLKQLVYTAFGYGNPQHPDIDRIYTKIKVSEQRLATLFDVWVSFHIPDIKANDALKDINTIEKMFEKIAESNKAHDEDDADADADVEDADADADADDANEQDNHMEEEYMDVDIDEDMDQTGNDDEEDKKTTSLLMAYAGITSTNKTKTTGKTTKTAKPTKLTLAPATPIQKETVVHLLTSRADKIDRETKINKLNISLQEIFPQVEGDKVTFIGSTFLTYGEKRPYLNHCVVIDTCNHLKDEVANSEIQTCKTERELLLAWTDIIQRENPDIIIGYNICGFDFEFMFRRSLENSCENEFLKLSRNKGEFCGTRDYNTGKIGIKESSIVIASGQHDLHYIEMKGRLQIDLYNYFRRDFNLTSYKLDYCAGYFIGDGVKKMEHLPSGNTKVNSANLMGLENGNYIHFEESSHSTDTYKDGAKFKVTNVNLVDKTFEIEGHEMPDMTKSVRWGLAKDDVTPQDIFRMTNEGPAERAIIAKYCIQDCNLVHHLMNKIDVMTGYIEMAKICSVPISFLVLRGQSIKLTSFIAKKCREKRTLMPVIERSFGNESYEGAICLPPKCNLYLDNPVACLDYSSLYPSSMISENLSQDSKVWTKEFDLAGQLVRETGVKDPSGNYIYDNMPGYEYVDVTYDTYKWVANQRGRAIKTLNGTKICRFAQPKDGVKAIMPTVLEELLAARKATRKMAEATEDPFMANILDKRQLGYKVTANSLYGQCGAKTSTFYDVDIAASTTATGRKLLTYGKRIVEEVYGDAKIESKKFGFVNTKAEYIYGDSVANYTPIYIRSNAGQLNIIKIDELAQLYGDKNGWVYSKQEGKEGKEYCEMIPSMNIETWSDKGWTKLNRIIRHRLAPHKKMIRVLTHTGLVDVTDDHSLVDINGNEISPKDVKYGTSLLHNNLPINSSYCKSGITVEEAQVMGFFFGDGSCGMYNCPSGKKKSWALNNASMDIINKYVTLCSISYPNFKWKYLNTIDSSGVYKIVPSTDTYGDIARFVEKYRKLMYNNKAKVIPHEILFNTEEIRMAFWNGMYDADGDKDANGYIRIDQKNQISAANICWLAQSLGWKTSLNTRSDKENIYRVTMTKLLQRKPATEVKKIHEISYPDGEYVYDLTTENHHFAAGIGNIIVHNTDSVFFTFNLATSDGIPIRGKDALEITIEFAKEVGNLATKFLKSPHAWVYEKTLMPFCLLSKKRYIGMLYEDKPEKPKRKSMGIVLKRRDNAPIVKDIYGGVIDILMKEQNVETAIKFLKASLQNLVDEKVSMDKLIISKSLRSGYKNPAQIAHKVLADRMGKRDPGNKPSIGDRIPFVYIQNPDKKALQGERIEHPDYILANKIKPNYAFYITNQIMKPIQQVFALVLENIPSYKRQVPGLKRTIDGWVDKLKDETNDEKIRKKIADIRNKEVKKILFDEYLIEIDNSTKGNQNIMSFFKKV
uniref:DNA polymerase n=1 Tax=viral metagenome TaxID=1070528 RepID=A0A6C0EYH4_9ZZZZ